MKGGRLGGGACGEPGVLHVLSQSLNDIVKDMIFHLCRSSDEAPLSGPAPLSMTTPISCTAHLSGPAPI